ncbi:electron transfer flavoprotein subunit alpha/FixB family protein [Serinibacter arcticus]|uniref:Electron transfer flavoprotein, alpha subunit n=1 Tax=Serinibacter arcticus TaxID=1655435 RepID=A0A4Z1DWQ8_9MICO|nr:electron transfer flavoprotein subunit alpha/FixB family protein [Serinibacter arcticus]TGO03986.1 Electron transfer flavoprotein, alpha subunit [Serinibacter arcticus]
MSTITVAVVGGIDGIDRAKTSALVALAARAGDVAVVTLEAAWTSARQAAALVAHLDAAGSDTLVLASSHRAKELAALVAHARGAGLVVDAHALEREGDRLVGHKRELGGTWDVSCAVVGPAVVLAKPPPADEVELTLVPLPEADVVGRDVEVLSRTEHAGDGRPALADATVVVAGGRGLEGDLTPVQALADALGGAVGATRDIVEDGWIGHETMVGQTGTIISPRLYIGAGISGAPHHRLGMQASEVIVAINIDADAPIMEIADFAVVGSAADVLLQAADEIAARRAR